jgi:hypothetical protein
MFDPTPPAPVFAMGGPKLVVTPKSLAISVNPPLSVGFICRIMYFISYNAGNHVLMSLKKSSSVRGRGAFVSVRRRYPKSYALRDRGSVACFKDGEGEGSGYKTKLVAPYGDHGDQVIEPASYDDMNKPNALTHDTKST